MPACHLGVWTWGPSGWTALGEGWRSGTSPVLKLAMCRTFSTCKRDTTEQKEWKLSSRNYVHIRLIRDVLYKVCQCVWVCVWKEGFIEKQHSLLVRAHRTQRAIVARKIELVTGTETSRADSLRRGTERGSSNQERCKNPDRSVVGKRVSGDEARAHKTKNAAQGEAGKTRGWIMLQCIVANSPSKESCSSKV